jgi:hypothetical protein
MNLIISIEKKYTGEDLERVYSESEEELFAFI